MSDNQKSPLSFPTDEECREKANERADSHGYTDGARQWPEYDCSAHRTAYVEGFKECFGWLTTAKLEVMASPQPPLKTAIDRVVELENCIEAVDDHLRQMRLDGEITMKQMCVALKVISDRYHTPTQKKLVKELKILLPLNPQR